ncbi:hypothetical protein [Prescottella equi]|uniref:hypothetical protein n=1 Tax=Rhodococcus hoagii TaxID=43767 RepID=UPI000A11D61B|nr:hypothetical protein [Prescottella equi]ORL35001.1 hypothetical protein A6I91_01995 [Prescottella equi]
MSGTIYLEIDGNPVPTSELVWEQTAPCGCADGWTTVREDCLSDEQAWKSLSGSAAMVKRDKQRGFTIALVRRDKSRIQEGICQHDPQWGIPARPTPAGHTWAVSVKAKSKALHLVPLVIEKDSMSPFGDEADSVCGRTSGRMWSTEWWCTDGLIECVDCWKKGAAA